MIFEYPADISRHDPFYVYRIPLDDIWLDPSFNCRGRIVADDVGDLIKDIRANGLQTPISLQPARDCKNRDMPEGKRFRIVAGHCRFVSYTRLRREDPEKYAAIPAMVKVGLTEKQARLFNIAENLKRRNLNIKQEATTVCSLLDLGMTQHEIASELGESRGWVQVRLRLMDLDPRIVDLAAAGVLTQAQINECHGIKDRDRRFEYVRQVRTALVNGVKYRPKKKTEVTKARRRTPTEIKEMIDHVGRHSGYGFVTRVLAWANGEVSDVEIEQSFAQYTLLLREIKKTLDYLSEYPEAEELAEKMPLVDFDPSIHIRQSLDLETQVRQ